MTWAIGHALLGPLDAPGCGTTSPDPGYPTYDAYPAGSIGEFGFNTNYPEIYSPASVNDIQSRCAPWWVSPYNYARLFNKIVFPGGPGVLQPLRPAVDKGESAAEREYLHLNFRMHRDGAVELLPGFHLSDVRAPPEQRPEAEEHSRSPVAFELRDASSQVIGFYRCHLTGVALADAALTDPAEWDPDRPYHDFHEVVPWEDEARSIAFFRDGGEVAKVEVEEQAPEITVGSVTELDDTKTRIRLEWEAKGDAGPLTYVVRYRNDKDSRWVVLAQGLTEPRLDVDLDSLPGGEGSCVFQVGASSTIRTSVVETDAVSVPVKPRRPYIVSPEPESTFLQGESVVLRGVGYSPDFETAPPDEVVWTSNVAGYLGHGHVVSTEALSPGLHKITLGVADGLGGEASADVLIKINPKEE